MVHRYRTLGFRLASDRPLPGLREDASTDGAADLELSTDAAEFSELEAAHQSREPEALVLPSGLRVDLRASVASDGSSFLLSYSDDCRFVLAPQQRRLVGRPSDDYSADYFATYVTGPVLAFALRLAGGSLLHAAAIEIDDKVVAVTGPGGAGKSTLTAALARAGYVVMGDDLVGLSLSSGRVLAHPGPSRIRLWRESAEAIFGDETLPMIAPDWDKRYADARHGVRFASDERPLAAVLFLEGGQDPGVLSSALPYAEAATLLAASVPAPYLSTRETRATELSRMASIAELVPVRRLGWGDGLDDLEPLLGGVARARTEAP